MGFSKKSLHHRDEISGIHVHDDIANGSHGAQDLSARNAARQEDLNSRIRGDWPGSMTSSVPEASDPTLGNAMSRLPKPSDFIVGSKAARFGSSAEDDSDSSQGGAPQKPSKQKGVEPARKRA
ncbi:MAG TPA: hypothetical protein VFO46_06025 [Candidatus Sulfotelmatobacter sp.]|nr:hypothetical protein [Candidatus Sulfotelmatobacter sp.]